MGQKLGQHFLNSKSVAKDIVSAANIKLGEKILEIGPGKGILTDFLLKEGATVFAVEKDHELVEYLNKKFKKEVANKKLILIEKDVRDFKPSVYELDAGNYKLVANIPYYITGEILRIFLERESQPSSIVLLIQNEVAKRIASKDKESVLSISVKVYGKPSVVKKVPKRYFSPAPKVDSAILKIENISKNYFIDLDEKDFFKVLKTGFSQKRKMVVGNLQKIANRNKILKIFEKHNINTRARAEDIILEKWIALAKEIF